MTAIDDKATDDPGQATRRFALVAFAVRIVAAGLAFVVQVVLARLIGPDHYGEIATGLTVVLLVTCLATLSLDNASQHFIAAYRATGDDDGLRGYLRRTPVIVGVVSLVISLPAVAISAWLGNVTLAILLATVPILALMAMFEGFAKSFDWPILALAPQFVVRPLLMVAVVVLMIWAGTTADAPLAAWGLLVSAVAVLAIQGFILRRRIAGAVPHGSSRTDTRRWITVSTPILIGDFGGILIVSADVIALSLFAGSAEAGIYFAAIKSLALVQFVAYAVSQASAHQASALYAVGDLDGLKSFVRRASVWTFIPSLAFALVLLAAGPWILMLFGSEFSAGYPAMAIVTLGFVVRAAVGPAARVLTMIGQERKTAFIHVAAGLFALVTCLALVPVWGIIGAATALSATLCVETVLIALALYTSLNAPSGTGHLAGAST
jgi:O-antigen/teichoic acid export membrane protein